MSNDNNEKKKWTKPELRAVQVAHATLKHNTLAIPVEVVNYNPTVS